MPRERNAFKLGLTMLVLFALFVGVLIFIAGGIAGGAREITVRFPDGTVLPPLATGSEVRFGSLVVGQVARIEFVDLPLEPIGTTAPAGPRDAEGRHERVYFDIVLDVDRRVELREDCKITVASPIIGAIGTVLIKERGMSPKRLPEGATVVGVPAASIEQLTESLVDVAALVSYELDAENPTALLARIKRELNAADSTSLLGKIHKTGDDLNRISAAIATQLDAEQRDVLMAKLHTLMDNINQTTARLRDETRSDHDGALVGKVHAALDALNVGLTQASEMIVEARQPVRDTLAAVEATAVRLDQGISKPVAEQLDADNAAGLLANIHVAVGRINGSLEDLNAITEATRGTVNLNMGRIDTSLANFKEASDHLRAGLKDLRLNPWRMLYTPTPSEARQDSIFRAARDFTEAAAHLDDSVARFKALAESRQSGIPSDDKQLLEVRARLAETFGNFTKAEKALWEELDVD